MPFQTLARILIASLTFWVSGAHTALSQPFFPLRSTSQQFAPPEETFFKCIPYGNDFFITIAQKGEKEAALFLWERENFDSEVSPQEACNDLSQRLTDVVAQNGGHFKSLLLTMGRVSGETVMCLVNTSQKGCNESNTLFTLNKKDAKRYARKPDEFLKKLTSLHPQDCQNPIFQLAGSPSIDIDRQTYFSLDAWENQFFGSKVASKINHSTCAFPCLEKW